MMRETRTLKGLFPDPKPPRRKNFIKENVKNLRRMEQLFHTTNKSANDLKLSGIRPAKPVSKQKISANHNGDSNENLNDEEVIQNGMSKLLSKQNRKDENTRKKSAPLLSSKKPPLGKSIRPLHGRPSLNGNLLKKNQCNGDQIDCKNKAKHKLKAYSEGNVAQENVDNESCDITDKWRNQEVQTLNTNDMDSLYSEGVIRYPTGRSMETQTPKLSDRGDTLLDLDGNEVVKNSSDCSTNSSEHGKSNKERVSLASKLASQLNNSVPPPNYRVGVVPKYIKERKEALQKEKLAKASSKLTDCPSGHVPLPDNERKETLSMLKKNYQEYVSELNMLPIRTDTLRSQKRKMEIEKQLTKLEEAIKVFSRPKVFVKVDS